ncbi:uncharacterized protein LOC101861305 [Aplysia californica]|uniref:Uncharacterized protein LOC101861305 n=1 Tax=Aplysia californica TaxID=6500 RepID=A0ABM0JZ32_APLCA|nr:uncharacterized protein LOC101861305 [Aplysia californica]
MALTLLHKICFHSHVIGFVALVCVFSAPAWLHLHSTEVYEGRHLAVDIGLMMKCIETEPSPYGGGDDDDCHFLHWSDFNGHLPGWVNGARVMEGVSLYIMLVVVIVDIVMTCCRRCKTKWFLAQGILCLHAGMLSIAAVVMVNEYRHDLRKILPRDREYGWTTVSPHWAYYLACLNAGFLTLSGIYTLFARNSGEESNRLVEKPPPYPSKPSSEYGTVQETRIGN